MADPSGILNWRRLAPDLTSSGQPSEAELAALRDLGVTRVINLGLHSHPKALPDEAATLAGLGMTYLHLPVDFQAPDEADFERFREALAARDGAVTHVHCIMNYRVSAFVYRWRQETLGWTEAKARTEMERIWRPGGVWAAIIGDLARIEAPHLYAGRDYNPDD
jgi:protein tyrosine phosphatase (PTP) superfamily phosphohydrolase (DUF442 family)